MQRHTWFLLLFLNYMFISVVAAKAELLQGGIEQSEILPKVNLQAMVPQIDNTQLGFKPKCVCLNPDTVQRINFSGREKIVDGGLWLLDFGSRADLADQALATIKQYHFTQMCNVGGSATNNYPQMQFFLSDGKAPQGPIRGEDALYFDNNKVKVEQINGSWKVTEGDHWMLDFASDRQAAENAADVIHYYGFDYECFVGRPGAPMMYFRK